MKENNLFKRLFLIRRKDLLESNTFLLKINKLLDSYMAKDIICLI